MRISDWSSDVCSSDLLGAFLGLAEPAHLSFGQHGLQMVVRCLPSAAQIGNVFAARLNPQRADTRNIEVNGFEHQTLPLSTEHIVAKQNALLWQQFKLQSRGDGLPCNIQLMQDRKSTRLNSSH